MNKKRWRGLNFQVLLFLWCMSLALVSSADDVPTLRQKLHSAEGNSRKQAMRNLMILKRDQKAASVNALAEDIKNVAKTDSDPKNRSTAILLLSQSRNVDLFSIASDLAKHDTAFEVRVAAIDVLGRIENSSSTSVLAECLKSDPHAYGRLEAALHLGKRGQIVSAEDVAWKETKKANPMLLRARAIEVVGEIGGDRHLKEIQEIANDPNESPEAQYSAVVAVNSIQYHALSSDSNRVNFLKTKVRESPTMRWAIGKLVQMRSIEAAQALLDIARTTDPYGSALYTAKPFARQALEALYDDGSDASQKHIDAMLLNGQAEALPAK